MRTREAIGSLSVESYPGSDCMARYAGSRSRPNGATVIWGDIRVANNATQLLVAGTQLNLLDRHLEISAQLVNPVPTDYNLCLPGETHDYLIFPARFSGPEGTEDKKLYCIGSFYTANGWDRALPATRGPSGGQMYNFAQFWKSDEANYKDIYLYVSNTGGLEIYNKFGAEVAGTYKIWVMEQTGKRYGVP